MKKLLVVPLAAYLMACGAPLETSDARPTAEEVGAQSSELQTPARLVLGGKVSKNEWHDFEAIDVAPSTPVTLEMRGLGDPDLFVRFGGLPSSTSYDCAPELSGAYETCTLTAPASGKLYVSVYGYDVSPNFTLTVGYTPKAPVQPMPVPSGIAPDFSNYVVMKSARIRDGGSLLLEGNLNRSFSAKLRLDGALGSPTRGHVFVKIQELFLPEQPERELTTAEIAQLRVGLADETDSVAIDFRNLI